MPRTLQPDRQLFLVTLALCLIGAVMVFSASAVMAREQYGNPYFFLIRQLVWIVLGIAGMFWLMKADYRKLRQPRVIFTALAVTLLLLLVAIFYLAWFLEMRRGPRGPGVNHLTQTIIPVGGVVLLLVGLVLVEPDMG